MRETECKSKENGTRGWKRISCITEFIVLRYYSEYEVAYNAVEQKTDKTGICHKEFHSDDSYFTNVNAFFLLKKKTGAR